MKTDPQDMPEVLRDLGDREISSWSLLNGAVRVSCDEASGGWNLSFYKDIERTALRGLPHRRQICTRRVTKSIKNSRWSVVHWGGVDRNPIRLPFSQCPTLNEVASTLLVMARMDALE
jgi:hypothetical protein